MDPTGPDDATERAAGPRILSTVFVTFVGYLMIGVPLAVLPGYVTSTLGYGTVLAGLTISAQYLSTIVTRANVGRFADAHGPKRAVIWGFCGGVASGLLTLGASLCPGRPALSLTLLLVGRLGLGLTESFIGTGAIAWAIGQVGPRHTARIISWNGIATYGALAVGAPAGVALAHGFGFVSLGLGTCAIGLVGLGLAVAKPGVAVIVEPRLGARAVIARVLPYGCALACASVGFGVIAAFVALHFEARHWAGAPFCLSCFGLSFIAARLMLGQLAARHGGLRVTVVALLVELAGLLLLWMAPGPLAAMLGAGLTGFGFAPIFPALGVEAVGRVPPQSRGAALGLYSMFLDVALGLQGPAAGLLIPRLGSAAPFGLGAVAAAVGLALTAVLLAR